MNEKKIVFLEVKRPSEKLGQIVKISLEHLEKKIPLWILVADPVSLKFVDELLWKFPEEGMLPHSIEKFSSHQAIILTQEMQQGSRTGAVLNLTKETLLWDILTIFELDDVTSEEKKMSTKKKFQEYRERGFLIESRS